MRVSGLVLMFLALAHFAITHIINDVVETDDDFVGRAVAQPAVAAVRLAAARPGPGPRAQRAALDHRRLRAGPEARAAVKAVLYTVTGVLFVYGTFTIVTFGD